MPNRAQVIRWIIWVLGLAAINLLVSFALILTIFLYYFRGDPILADVPAVLDLPAIVLQPWFLVLFFVPLGHIALAPLLTTVITIFVYGSLHRHGLLERPKRFLFRFKPRTMLAIAGGFFALAGAVAVSRYVDLPVLNRGVPPSVQFLGLNVIDSRYYCLGEFIDSEWAWQARAPESELDRLVARFELRPLDPGEIPAQFHSMPPYWWHPSITERTRVLSTSNFPLHERGTDGWHAIATWSPDDELLHVWIKDNF
jgi:hypothetical protein